jgi:hypothetical protein
VIGNNWLQVAQNREAWKIVEAIRQQWREWWWWMLNRGFSIRFLMHILALCFKLVVYSWRVLDQTRDRGWMNVAAFRAKSVVRERQNGGRKIVQRIRHGNQDSICTNRIGLITTGPYWIGPVTGDKQYWYTGIWVKISSDWEEKQVLNEQLRHTHSLHTGNGTRIFPYWDIRCRLESSATHTQSFAALMYSIIPSVCRLWMRPPEDLGFPLVDRS